ncbi:hypothetical protein AAMO2058_001488800 [Amorphochlora amoebiformis]
MSLFGNSGGSAFGGSGSSGTSLFGNSSGAESRKGGNSQGGSSMFGGSSGSKRGSSLFGGGGSGSLFSGGERNSGNVSAFMTAKVDFKDLDSNKKSDLLKLESLIQMQIRMITDLEEHFKARKAQKDQLYKQGMSDLSREITMLGSSISQTTNEVQGFDRKVRHEVRKKDMASHLLYKIQDKSVNKLQARLQLPSGYFIHKIKDFRTSMQQLDRFVHSALHSNDVGSPLALKETLRRQHDALINITGKVASVTAIMNDLRNRYRTYRVKYHNDTSDPFEVKKPPLMISDEPLWQNVQTKASSQSNGSSLFGGGSGGTSLFGGNKSGSAFGSGSGTSLFGNSSGSGTSLFGNSSGSGTSLFGNSSGSSGGGSGGGGSSGGLFGSSGSGGGSSIFGGSSGSGGGGGSLFGSGGSGGSGSGGTSLFGGGDFGSKKR